jgi:hypothetical protein
MKKLFLTLLLSLSLVCNANAQEQAKTFPEQGLQVFLGLDDTSSPPIVKDGRAAAIQNITLDNTGQASKRYGYAFYSILDTTDLVDSYEAVTGLYELYLSSGTKYKLATCGSKLFSVSTAGVKTDITGSATITEGQNYQFIWTSALDYAIGTNGYNPPLKTNGVTSSALSFTGLSSAVTKAKCVAWWKNYLIFGNTTEGSTAHTTRIRWSNVGTIETWSDNDYVDIATKGGQQIEAMATLYDDLYIFLTDSIYKVSLVGGDELINVGKVSEGIGCIAKNSVKTIGIGNSEGIIFLSRDKTINFLDGVKVTDISSLIETTTDDLYASRLQYAVAVDDRVNSHYYLAVTTGAVDDNNLLLDYHYGIGEWSKHTQIDANAMCIADDANSIPQVYFGNYYSIVYKMNDADLYSDCAGETGIVDAVDSNWSDTESGVQVLYDSSATLTDVTGAIVRITSGTGSGEEAVIVGIMDTYVSGSQVLYSNSAVTGILVYPTFTTTPDSTSAYSIGDIPAYYTTKWYDMGSSPLRKNYGEIFVWSTTATSATMQVYYATDFSSTIESLDLASTASGSLWGTAIWGTDTWAGMATSLTRLPLNVSGRFIKFKFDEPSIDEPMDLMGYAVIYWGLDSF